MFVHRLEPPGRPTVVAFDLGSQSGLDSREVLLRPLGRNPGMESTDETLQRRPLPRPHVESLLGEWEPNVGAVRIGELNACRKYANDRHRPQRAILAATGRKLQALTDNVATPEERLPELVADDRHVRRIIRRESSTRDSGHANRREEVRRPRKRHAAVRRRARMAGSRPQT